MTSRIRRELRDEYSELRGGSEMPPTGNGEREVGTWNMEQGTGNGNSGAVLRANKISGLSSQSETV